MSTGSTCPNCGRVHGSDCVIALRRFFKPDITYRARFDGAPERDKRPQAEADWCHHHATKERP